ncbi:MAG: hypothetical protein DCC57_11045 [Chloroflexi bacterium]|nr:MAG: hypothetical protein DCC57_11045 [Chloroflexota bacterium]
MFQPNILEELAAERQRDLVREARQMHLLASLRPPRRPWRVRLGHGMQAAGERLSNWGCRLAAAQTGGAGHHPLAVSVQTGSTFRR